MVISKNQKGLTIVEVLIASALTAFVTLAIMQFTVFMSRFQIKNSDYATAMELRTIIYRTLLNEEAWANTVNDASNGMTCMQTTLGDCRGQSGTTLELKDQNDNTVFDSSTATNGYTHSGRPCTTYSTTPTNYDCPYRFNFSWSVNCHADTDLDCIDPIITVSVDMDYSTPTSSEDLKSRDIGLGDDSASSASNLDFVILKRKPNTEIQKSKTLGSFNIRIMEDAGTDNGACTVSTWVPQELKDITVTGTENAITDTFGNTTYVNGATTFTLKAGKYDCTGSQLGYKVNNFRIRLRDNTAGANLLLGTSEYSNTDALSTSSSSEMTGIFEIAVDSSLSIDFWCNTTTSTEDMGPSIGNDPEIYGSFDCVRIE